MDEDEVYRPNLSPAEQAQLQMLANIYDLLFILVQMRGEQNKKIEDIDDFLNKITQMHADGKHYAPPVIGWIPVEDDEDV